MALTTQAGLGTSPISSVPYVLTWLLKPLSFGMTTFLVNILFVAGQAVILRKRFALVQWCQLIVVFIFSAAIDLGMWLAAFFLPELYALKVLESIAGSAALALGIALQIHANVMLNPGEGFVKALCYVIPVRFAFLKIGFDVSLVLCSIVIALLSMGHLEGIREGTLLAALLVGLFLRVFLPWTRPLKKLTYLPKGHRA